MNQPSRELAVTTVVDVLSDAIQARVLDGEWAPGDKVTEQDVAAMFGVSRPTAKAAIDRVAQTGVLRRTANRAARVPMLAADDVVDLYRSRTLLEMGVVASLARAKRGPAAADSALVAMTSAVESESFGDFAAADIAFHRALVEALGSPRILRMYETVIREAHLCIIQEQDRVVRSNKLREHVAILDAIRRGDEAAATELMHDHLQAAVTRLVERDVSVDYWD